MCFGSRKRPPLSGNPEWNRCKFAQAGYRAMLGCPFQPTDNGAGELKPKGDTAMQAKTAVLVAAAFLSACASRPAHHTEATVGRITSVTESDSGPSSSFSSPMIAPAAPVLINITVEFPPASARVYTYKIQGASGRIIQTQSPLQFPVGSCVRLWHAPQAAGDRQSAEIAGTLEEGSGCN